MCVLEWLDRYQGFGFHEVGRHQSRDMASVANGVQVVVEFGIGDTRLTPPRR